MVVRVILLTFLGLLAASAAQAQVSLSFSSASVSAGGSGVITADIVTDGSAVALQFDVLYDPAIVSIGTVNTGGALTANHSIASSPIGAGRDRVVVTTAPITALNSGVLASLNLSVAASAASGSTPITWDNVVISDAVAVPITPASLTPGAITIAAGSGSEPEAIPAVPVWIMALMIVLVFQLANRYSRIRASFGRMALLGVLCLFSSPTTWAQGLPGDANNDGVLDIEDVRLIVERILELGVLPGDGDCNRDSTVNVLDTVCSQVPFVPGETTPIILGPGDRSIAADLPFAMNLFAADPDVRATQTWTKEAGPAALSVSSTGVLTWTPAAVDEGDNSVSVRVTDDTGRAAVATFTISVFVLSAPPAANEPPQLTVPDDQQLAVGVAIAAQAGAIDPDTGDSLSYSLVNAPDGMTIDSATGVLSWTPLITQAGFADVVIKVSDEAGASDFGSFTVEATVANGAPVGVDDVFSAFVGGTTTVAAGEGVLINDSDPEGDDLSAVLLEDSTPGELVLRSDGSFDYTPQTPVLLTQADAVSGELVSQAGPVRVAVSSSQADVRRDRAIDGDATTSWFTATGDAANLGSTPFIELVFPQDVTVDGLEILGDREEGGDARVEMGEFQLFDRKGVEIFSSGVVTLPAANYDLRVDFPAESGARRARFTFVSDASSNPGVGDFRVYGDAQVRRYKQATNVLLSQNSPIEIAASSEDTPTLPVSNGADQSEGTYWAARADDVTPIFDISFAAGPVTVTRLEVEGPKGGTGVPATSNAFLTAEFVLLDALDNVLWTSPVVDLTLDAERDAQVVVPSISGVTTARFVGLSVANSFVRHGIAELRVYGDGPVWPIRPIEEWTWETSTLIADQINVANTPIVIDLDNDGDQEMVFAGSASGNFFNNNPGNVIVLDASTGAEQFAATDSDLQVNSAVSMAAGDIDNDGLPEIVAVARVSPTSGFNGWQLLCFENDLTLKWRGDEIEALSFGAIAIANVDGSGLPEIVVGRQVVNADDGSVRWTGSVAAGDVPIVADIDLDGDQEVISGSGVYSPDGTLEWSEPLNIDWNTSVANFDDDPYAEVAFAYDGRLSIYNHDGTAADQFILSGVLGGGPPTIADYDGDGKAEIGVLRSAAYVVYEADGYILWEQPLDDGSRRTGSVVLDLDGDGSAEAVHRDENFLRIYRGIDGEVLFQTPISSATANESPIAADIDGDGQAELVVTGTIFSAFGRRGVFAFGGFDEDWVKTRSIWNQHAYSITNVGEDGTIPESPRINWLTPSLNNFRQNGFLPEDDSRFERFTYRVDAGGQFSGPTTVSIDTSMPNSPPEIVSLPDTRATAGFEYLSAVDAVDPDFDELVFTLAEGPGDMTIDGANGLLRWSPDAGDIGTVNVTVAVTDAGGLSVFQRFELTVGDTIAVPDVVGLTRFAAQTALEGDSLDEGQATFRSDPVISSGIVISQFPIAGATVEAGADIALLVSTGPGPLDTDDDGDGFSENEGDCNDGDAGVFPGAADANGDGIDQDCDGLDGNKTLVAIEVTPASKRVLADEVVGLTATGIFDDGTAQNLTEVAVWSGGPVFSESSAGSYDVEVSFRGIDGSATFEVVNTVVEASPPVVMIATPESGDEIGAPIDVSGTVTDANLVRWELAYQYVGEETYVLVAEGSDEIDNNRIASFDPSALLNGLYTLRLRAWDAGGNGSQDSISVLVDSQLKVGNFTLRYVDLELQLSGIPISVVRSYDSRDKRIGDFGVGWQLGVNSIEIRKSRELGTGWFVGKQGFAYGLVETDGHLVALRLPGGRIEAFEMAVTPNISPIFPFPPLSQSVGFRPLPGTLGTLEALDESTVSIFDPQPGEVSLRLDSDGSIYDPSLFRYTTPDGAQFDIDTIEGIQRAETPAGQVLTFTPTSITHSNGAVVDLERDDQGRIVRITDPGGFSQTYAYDANGDLRTHSDQESFTTRFDYDAEHNLIAVTDPLNRNVVRNEYDDDGRLISATNENGDTISYVHDVGGRQEVVTDPEGFVTVYDYDDFGNVLRSTDPLGGVTTNTYDASGNRLTTTNPEGETTTYTYDERENLLSVTDPIGATTEFSYDDSDRLSSATDALGRVTSYVYDSAGRTTRVVNALGDTARATAYDAAGNVISESDARGSTRTFEYDSSGYQLARIDALGNRVERVITANGHVTQETDARGNRSTMGLDARGLPTLATAPEGNSMRFEYDGNARLRQVIGESGETSTRVIDARGLVTRMESPDGSAVQSFYDGRGRRTRIIDGSGRETSYEHDGLGRRISTRLPGGATSTASYDLVGRVLTETDANGNTTSYEYDAGGRNTAVVDALGERTEFTYDLVGNLTARLDARGNTTRYRYDALDRLVETEYADGSTETRDYDPVGNVLVETDRLGRSKSYTYDANDNLLTVTERDGGVASFAYDQNNNRTSQTDANGNTTRMVFDDNDRLIAKQYPDGSTERFEYDGNGQIGRTILPDGKYIDASFDGFGRPTGHDLNGEATESFGYDGAGRITEATNLWGTIEYSYDSDGRVTEIRSEGGHSVSYSYDDVGNRSTLTTQLAGQQARVTTYTYDALNRLATIVEPDGDTTAYVYDPVGNVASITYPNGVTSAFTYDNVNQLTRIVHRRASTTLAAYDYTLDAGGRRLRVDHPNDDSVSYSYDDADRLLRETHRNSGGVVIFEQTYAYDAVGNRVTQQVTGQAETVLAYDSADKLITAGSTSFAYDANGRLRSRTAPQGTVSYTYDVEGQLLQVTNDAGTITYGYDALGKRRRRHEQTNEQNFLLDEASLTGYDQTLLAFDENDNQLVEYHWGDRLISADDGVDNRYYHFDASRNTRVLTNEAGSVSDTLDYDGFGNVRNRTGVSESPYGFAGEWQEEAEGLVFLRARFYDPTTGRFISRDPFGGNATDPVSLHRYLYANANPIMNTDPTGEFTLVEQVKISALLAFNVSMWSSVFNGEKFWNSFGKALISAGFAAVGGAFAGKVAGPLIEQATTKLASLVAIHAVKKGIVVVANATVQGMISAAFGWLEAVFTWQIADRNADIGWGGAAKLFAITFVAEVITQGFWSPSLGALKTQTKTVKSLNGPAQAAKAGRLVREGIGKSKAKTDLFNAWVNSEQSIMQFLRSRSATSGVGKQAKKVLKTVDAMVAESEVIISQKFVDDVKLFQTSKGAFAFIEVSKHTTNKVADFLISQRGK